MFKFSYVEFTLIYFLGESISLIIYHLNYINRTNPIGKMAIVSSDFQIFFKDNYTSIIYLIRHRRPNYFLVFFNFE